MGAWASGAWATGAWATGAWAEDGATEVTAPTVSSATINSAGTSITFAFSESVVATISTGFTLSMSGGAATATYSSGSGTSSLVYSLSRTIQSGETGTHSYTQPGNGIEDAAGNDLASYSGATVTNSSNVAPTILLCTAVAVESASTLKLYFSGAAYIGSGGSVGLSLTLSGGPITATYSSGSGTSALAYTLSRSVSWSESGSGSYTNPGNGIENLSGDDVSNFSFQIVNRVEYLPSTRYFKSRNHRRWWR